MKNERIYGIYKTPSDATRAVRNLRRHGYTKDEVKVISSRTIHEPIKGAQKIKIHDVDPTDDLEDYKEQGLYVKFFSKEEIDKYYEDDETLWERLKDTFTFTYPTKEEMILLKGFQKNLDQGHILIIVDETHKDDAHRIYDETDSIIRF